MYVKQPFPKDIIKTINDFGAALVPNLFDANTVQALEAEIDNTFSSLQPKDEACFTPAYKRTLGVYSFYQLWNECN